MIGPLVLLPHDGARHLCAPAAGSHGMIRFRRAPRDKLTLISFVHNGTSGYWVNLRPRLHPLNDADPGGDGLWCKVPVDLHLAWYDIARRHAAMTTFDAFKDMLPITLKDPGNTGYFVLTYAPDAADTPYTEIPIPVFAGWFVTRRGVEPVQVETEPETVGLDQIRRYWPVTDLAKVTALAVGVGSIGGAATRSLAGYGIGRLRLLDPDRLMWHNLIRHVLPEQFVGQYKVDGMRTFLADRYPDTELEAYRLDVVEHADQVRGMLADTDIVLCCADGVAARRTVSHLARQARRPAILACVLADGGIGEIIRLRPWPDHGCLLCRRQALSDARVLDPEPELEAEYGTGTLHRPMTAVGSDLALVGDLAAKLTVGTALEAAGHFEHRLPGESLTIGLQARRGWSGPFDLGFTGQTRWTSAPPPAQGCFTCDR
jgi:molybdopterin/thiamine biosynthesis adenylyltransferase